MNLDPKFEPEIHSYLDRAARAMGDHPASTREDILKNLECQIHETLAERCAGRDARIEDLREILAALDAPEAFVAGSSPDEPAPRRRPPSWAWFLVAVIALGLNGWAVWRMAAHRAPAAVVESSGTDPSGTQLVWRFGSDMQTEGKVPASLKPAVKGSWTWANPRMLVFKPESGWPVARMVQASLNPALRTADGRPLEAGAPITVTGTPPRLESAAQKALSADRRSVLSLRFNGIPDPATLRKTLSLATPDGKPVDWSRSGDTPSADVLIATDPIASDRVILTLAPGLRLVNADHASTETQTVTVDLSSAPALVGISARSPSFGSLELQLAFNQPMDPIAADGFFQIVPAVKTTVSQWSSWNGQGLRITGEFKPGHLYTLTCRKGLPAQNGQDLPREVVRQVQFPDRARAIAFSAEGRYVSPRGPMRLPVSAMNLTTAEVSIARLTPNNLVFFALRDRKRLGNSWTQDDAAAAEMLTLSETVRAVTFPDRPNEEQKLFLDLRELTGGELSGVYLIALKNEKCDPLSRIVAVTDLGLTVKRERGGVRVWATSLRDATPVAGATVTLFGLNNRELARGTTDARGLANLATGNPDPASEPFLVAASLGTDLSFLPLDGTEVAAVADHQRGAAYTEPGRAEAMVYTDRGIYRPGETVHVQTLVRTDGAAPAPFPLLLRVLKPNGAVHQDLPLNPDEFGAASVDIAVPDYLPTGAYTLEAVLPGTFAELGSTTVQVEDFVPPQIRVALARPKGRIAAGATAEFPVDAAFLFGRPAAGLILQSAVGVRPATFSSPHFPEYGFGDPEKTFQPVYRAMEPRRLNSDGKEILRAETNRKWRPAAALELAVSATVLEPGGRPVSAQASVPVDAYPFYVGLRPETDSRAIRVGQTTRVRVATVAPDGTATNAVPALKASWARMEWSSAMKRGADGVYRWTSERTLSCEAEAGISLDDGTGTVAFAPAGPGVYLLRVWDPASEASSSIMFNAAEPDHRWVDFSRERPDRAELELDRDAYAPGDVAKLTVRTPFAGTALLCVETDRVLEQRVLRLDGNTAEVELPVTEAWAPNVWCTLSALKPAGPAEVWSVHRAFGAVALKVKPGDRRLTVTIDPADSIRPRSKLPVRFTVTDAAGRPARAEVTVAAVDEAICGLTDFKTPDPAEYFLRLRGPGVTQFDLFQWLLPVLSDASAGAAIRAGAGDAGESLLARRLNPVRARRFKPVALWTARLRTDANGRGATEFETPEFTGRLRIMAVAFDARRGGSATGAVAVKRPLVAIPALPRFLAPGDTCEAAVTIFNETGADAHLAVNLRAEGPVSFDAPDHRFTLAAGGSTQVVARLTAARASGVARITFQASAGAERYEEMIELPVRPAGAPVSLPFVGVLAPGAEKTLDVPARWLAGAVHAEVWVSGRREANLRPALEFLLRYPYGCLEQTASASFPLLYLPDLLRVAPSGAGAAGDVESLVRSGILRILSMQTENGLFSLWPESRLTSDWASVYAAHFLVEAKRNGYDVPRDRLDALVGGLEARLEKSLPLQDEERSTGLLNDWEERAYACHVLALAGHPAHGWTARLRELGSRLSFAARMHTVLALKQEGRPREAAQMLADAGAPVDRVRQPGGCLGSVARDTALALLAWMEIDPAAPQVEAMAARLIALGPGGDWGTTQENAMALLALGTRARRAKADPADRAPFAARLTDGSLVLASGDREHPLHWVAPRSGAAGAWRLRNDGPGVCYYAARLEGVALDGGTEENTAGRLEIERAMLDDEGRPVGATKLRAGDRVVIRITVRTRGETLDNLAVTELLPAGLEIENPNVAGSGIFPWIPGDSSDDRKIDARDDRLVVFFGGRNASAQIFFTVRAVTPGVFVWPGTMAEAMYDPSVRAVLPGGRLEVTKP